MPIIRPSTAAGASRGRMTGINCAMRSRTYRYARCSHMNEGPQPRFAWRVVWSMALLPSIPQSDGWIIGGTDHTLHPRSYWHASYVTTHNMHINIKVRARHKVSGQHDLKNVRMTDVFRALREAHMVVGIRTRLWGPVPVRVVMPPVLRGRDGAVRPPHHHHHHHHRRRRRRRGATQSGRAS